VPEHADEERQGIGSARPLGRLVAGAQGVAVEVPPGAGDVMITSIDFDSREVGPGALFCCLRGEQLDGHAFAAGAVAAGAAALLVDHRLDLPVPQLVAADTRRTMARLAASFHGHPSRALDVIGVTGTNGKTTTAHVIAAALDALGGSTGVIGTLSGAHTTPEAPELQRRLAEFRDEGRSAVAMEVSSHALALDRVAGTRFRVAIFTNLGRDHLDFHKTQERYFAAKASLFTPELSAHGVVNVDDVHGRLLADSATIPVTTYSLDDIADVRIGAFDHEYTWRGVRIRVALGGRFNVSNSLAAATTLAVLGREPAAIAAALAAVGPVPGRFEPVDAGQDFAVAVDYAHTPEALSEVLRAAREVARGRVIVVFGCGGDRDRTKRPAMGQAAASAADLVVVTSDNPRSEDPATIIGEVIAGVAPRYGERIVVEPDRRAAIALAVGQAAEGDVVVIAGKGHETVQVFADRVEGFDDVAVARAALEALP
jgi:UDP-N-acetylmuramoyl-L-alanyl-D-glutamate--2,6-diaminopimelate ligase